VASAACQRRTCKAEADAQPRDEAKRAEPATKQCAECMRELEASSFYRKPRAPDGLHHICRRCDAPHIRRYKLARGAPQVLPHWHACSLCKETKPADEFRPDRAATVGLGSWCKKCMQAAQASKRERDSVSPVNGSESCSQ